MSPARHSIKRQLRLGTIISSGIALLVACTSYLVYDLASDRKALKQSITTIADIFSYNSSAVLEFEDADGAADVLSALALQSGIRSARLYDVEGEPFADYVRGDVREPTMPAKAPPPLSSFSDDALTVVTRIDAGGEPIGTRVHRGVTEPILELTETAAEYSRDSGTARRAKPRSHDELGLLVTAFNQMLAQIERNEREQRAQVVRLGLMNTALKSQKDRADAAAEAKTRFLANMSHELRTPLTAIRGFLDLLGNSTGMGRLSEEQWEHLSVVDRNVDQLIGVINNVLDVTQLETGGVNLETVRYDLAPLLEEVRSSLAGAARKKKLRLEIECDGSIPDEVKGDPARLRQVLVQLVENAIKFTREGEVRVRATGHASPTGWVLQIDVTDTGIGIEDSQLADLFEPFDVILMDLQMPEMDGYEATRRLREQSYSRPIVALTANAIPEERQRCFEAGCDAVETKPIKGPALIRAIHLHLQSPKKA